MVTKFPEQYFLECVGKQWGYESEPARGGLASASDYFMTSQDNTNDDHVNAYLLSSRLLSSSFKHCLSTEIFYDYLYYWLFHSGKYLCNF